jgi:phage terminase small subunit
MAKRAPTYLNDIARAKWRELQPMLPDNEPTTLDALGQYCVAWSRWLSATDDDGKIRWSRVCRQWLGELRKTRSTRKAEQNTDDPVVRLLRQGGE